MTTKTTAQVVEGFLGQLKEVSDKEKLLVTSAVVDCLRYISSMSEDPRTAARPLQVANFIAAAHALPWNKLEFFATHVFTDDTGPIREKLAARGCVGEDADRLILQALPAFFELLADGVLESSPEIDQLQLLLATIDHIADTVPAPPKPAAPAPEIFTHKHSARVYTPKPLTPELFNDLGMAYGLYNRYGQQLRALRFNTSDSDYFIIRETGEVFLESRAAFDDETSGLEFEVYSRPEAFAKFPVSLLIYAHMALADAAVYRHMLSAEFVAAYSNPDVVWFTGRLGSFNHPVRIVSATQTDVQSLLAAIDTAGKHGSLPIVPSIQFSAALPTLEFTAGMLVQLCARRDGRHTRFTSELTRTKGANTSVVMRHDYPRQQLFGFYAFPLPNGLVNLTVQM